MDMSGKEDIKNLLKRSGYSSTAIEYFIEKVNVGKIEDHDAYFVYTGPCGDTMEIFLTIEPGSKVIKDAKFQAIGCAGAFASGSAITEMIKGKTVEEAKKIEEEDIIDWLGDIPKQKIHCACLAKKTLKFALDEYKGG
ncbi:iron-sulfur cluster assembly scaffold protein [Methanophagales archaeon]|nr:MAG: iron-sulfur cluster assembly scaffold protein [Methanophagales archaeon]RJS76017.1 MAG: iron-sulfur cluster assembly scaffold protein [Methanophagales archaeon]